ncbi:hypothetical protein GQX73_g5093 [Xylaria multiplex]|uniref:Uncharacterized protein n=1 Tax=Xylaria multiplex TaxID=323545 RepID=A0A7C8IT71_9PEZI|nr:hypothetical protein GQX73_g5093 [Xylaria multiplex]
MPTTSTPKPPSVAHLTKCLRLPGEAETEALLSTDQIREAFRVYRNRCLVSGRFKAAQLPDWKDVDAYTYELRLSSEFRRWAREAKARSSAQAKTAATVCPGPYLAKLCRSKPYVLMPHVAMFVLGVDKFLQSPEGCGFDASRDDGKGSLSRRESQFDRYARIMKILQFLVARDVG